MGQNYFFQMLFKSFVYILTLKDITLVPYELYPSQTFSELVPITKSAVSTSLYCLQQALLK